VAELAGFVREQVANTLGSLDAPHVVLGHSMGGAVALEYALAAPPGLRALALVSTGARLRVHPSILAAFAPDGDAMWPPAAASADARGFGLPTSVPRATALSDWHAANAFDRMARVHEIGTPTLILVGDADQLTPVKYARFLHERIRGSQLVVLPDAGHGLPSEHADDVAEHVAAFLREVALAEDRRGPC
jgi:pimeloyl-ACP methyl ester carboxylesterase